MIFHVWGWPLNLQMCPAWTPWENHHLIKFVIICFFEVPGVSRSAGTGPGLFAWRLCGAKRWGGTVVSGQTTLECLEVWRCQRARGHIVRKKIWKLIPKKIKMKPVKWELQRFRKDWFLSQYWGSTAYTQRMARIVPQLNKATKTTTATTIGLFGCASIYYPPIHCAIHYPWLTPGAKTIGIWDANIVDEDKIGQTWSAEHLNFILSPNGRIRSSK